MPTLNVLPLPPAIETTQIPVTGERGYLGAMAFFAVLAYPDTSPSSHARRDQLLEAIQDWITGWKRLRLGYRRVTSKRLPDLTARGVPTRQTLRNDRVFRALNRAERVIVTRRLLAANIAEQLAGVRASREFANSPIRIKIKGPQSLSAAIAFLAGQSASGDPSTLWRIWRDSLPVLHYAVAFRFHQPERKEGDRPDLIIRCVRDHSLWLQKTVAAADTWAFMLQEISNFHPSHRIALVPE